MTDLALRNLGLDPKQVFRQPSSFFRAKFTSTRRQRPGETGVTEADNERFIMEQCASRRPGSDLAKELTRLQKVGGPKTGFTAQQKENYEFAKSVCLSEALHHKKRQAEMKSEPAAGLTNQNARWSEFVICLIQRPWF